MRFPRSSQKKDRLVLILYVIYFLFLYIIARFISLYFLEPNIEIITGLHDFLIKIEVYSLKTFFNYFNLVGGVEEDTIIFSNSYSLRVLPGCSGLIQMFRIFFVLLFFPGSWASKLWYIPLSLVLVLIAAMVHLFILSYVLIYFPQQYDLAHDYITKIIFYGMYFLIWIYWLEKFVLKKEKDECTPSY